MEWKHEDAIMAGRVAEGAVNYEHHTSRDHLMDCSVSVNGRSAVHV